MSPRKLNFGYYDAGNNLIVMFYHLLVIALKLIVLRSSGLKATSAEVKEEPPEWRLLKNK